LNEKRFNYWEEVRLKKLCRKEGGQAILNRRLESFRLGRRTEGLRGMMTERGLKWTDETPTRGIMGGCKKTNGVLPGALEVLLLTLRSVPVVEEGREEARFSLSVGQSRKDEARGDSQRAVTGVSCSKAAMAETKGGERRSS